MKDNFFLDTSVLIYSMGQDLDKKNTSLSIIEKSPVISTQVINEFTSVMNRKFGMNYEDILIVTKRLSEITDIVLIDFETIKSACRVAEQYGFSYYDSLMVATALEQECDMLYTEDLQNGQLIDKCLKIYNPFV